MGLTWHREAHAFVALAKRAPDRAAMAMEAFTAHPSWWVRMYAARAAAAAGDVLRLDKLAYDANDNVREAALGPLRRLKKADADPAIVAALERNDVQLLRTAATLLKDSPPSDRTARALVAALLRLTKEGKETSRDARVPLLEAIDVHAGPDIALDLKPLLKDFDPVVAAKAASLVSNLTGKPAAAGTRPRDARLGELVRRSASVCQRQPGVRQVVHAAHGSGGGADHRRSVSEARARRSLLRRPRDPSHRAELRDPGRQPGANEYSGHKEYMRDEIGAKNSRGTVGLSTRGRNTADAQFYINLVDNLRLDQDYTVFAHVLGAGHGGGRRDPGRRRHARDVVRALPRPR